MSQVLGKVCTACGTERRKRGAIKYDPYTFLPYCEHPYICNDNHPNSPQNTVERGMEKGKENAELKLVDYEEAKVRYNLHLVNTHPDKEKAEKIRKMVNHPFTVRIGNIDRAEYLIDIQETLGLSNLTEAVRYCIDMQMDSNNGQYLEQKRLEQQARREEEIRAAMEALTNPKPELAPEPQTVDSNESDEDFTF